MRAYTSFVDWYRFHTDGGLFGSGGTGVHFGVSCSSCDVARERERERERVRERDDDDDDDDCEDDGDDGDDDGGDDDEDRSDN